MELEQARTAYDDLVGKEFRGRYESKEDKHGKRLK